MCKIKTKKEFKTQHKWNKYFGTYAEARFMEECARRGIPIAKSSEGSSIDFLIDLEDNGNYKTVQVKGVSLRGNEAEKYKSFYHLAFRSNKKNRQPNIYNKVDYFAYYISEYDIMYLVPINHILKKTKKLSKRTFCLMGYDSEVMKIKNKDKREKSFDIAKYKNW